MNVDMFYTIVISLASALVSSFLAAYLTYRYTDLSWRRRRHLEDIKEKCLNKILSDINRFALFFALSENQVSGWVRSERFFREPPSVA